MRKGLFLLLTIFVFFLIGCQREPSEGPPQEIKPQYGGVYRSSLDFEPRTLDPPKATDIYSVTVIQQLFDGLLQFDKDLNIVPALAKSWKVSPDGLVYTFFLRKGVKFHNGREVTAEDFIFSFTRIVRPGTGSDVKEIFDKISGVEEFLGGKSDQVRGLKTKDRYTLEITLKEPFAPFMVILAMTRSKVIPVEEVKKWGDKFGKHPVGTGAFRFVRWEPGKKIVLEANKDYFEGRPYLDRVIYRMFPGARYEEMFEEFSKGVLEKTIIPAERRNEVAKDERYQVVRRPSLSLLYYGLNTNIKPLDSKKVRQAISFAIDKERIIQETMKGRDVKAVSILPPGMPGYSFRQEVYPYDPERAKKLLAEVGYLGGKGFPLIEIWSASTTEATRKELEIIRSNLGEVGIQVEIKYEKDWLTYEGYLLAKKLPVFRYVWYADFPDPDNFLAILFHSRTKYNFVSYGNLEVDQLLEEARAEIDTLRRVDMYRRAEDTILEDAPIVPVLHRTYEEVYQPYVKGIEVSALGAPYIPMKKVWLDK